MPEQASTFALEVDLFYIALVLLTVVFSVAIGIAIFVFSIQYRRKKAGEIPEQIEGAMLLEITWTVIPFLMTLGIFAWGAKLYYQLYTPPKEALEIFVTGKQWMWRAQHPDGQREINSLHVPLGRRVKLTMTSEDVLHAYSIPAFRTKTDVVPGRYTTTWFEPTKAGAYHLFCAEYCGTQHSGMIGTVTVLDPADYQAWLNNTTRDLPPSKAGEKLFAGLACINCHTGVVEARGPLLDGVFGTQQTLDNGTKVLADETYLRESILNPNAKRVAGYGAVMPTFQGQVTEEQVAQLIAYIKSIGPKAESPAAPAAAPDAKPAPAAPQPVPAAPGAMSEPRKN
ncbi:MAG: cytochrome c oxidase subunit II [Blastocatellia bacterium]